MTDIKNQLTSGAHFLHRIIVQLVAQELHRRRSCTTIDSNNNLTDNTNFMRRLHFVAVRLSCIPGAWHRMVRELYSQYTLLQKQCLIDNIAAAHADESTQAFVGLCSWWDEMTLGNNTPQKLITYLERALRTCGMDDVVEYVTSSKKIPSITELCRRSSFVPRKPTFYLKVVEEEDLVSIQSVKSDASEFVMLEEAEKANVESLEQKNPKFGITISAISEKSGKNDKMYQIRSESTLFSTSKKYEILGRVPSDASTDSGTSNKYSPNTSNDATSETSEHYSSETLGTDIKEEVFENDDFIEIL